MRKLFNKLKSVKSINLSDELQRLKRNKDIFIFFIFLIVSTTFWLLNALRDTYVASFTFPVRYSNIPDNEIVVGPQNNVLQLRLKGTGFSILRQYLSSSVSSPTFDVSKHRRIQQNNNNRIFLLSREQRNYFVSQLYVGLELVEILPDTIFIDLQKLEKRKVPVKFNGNIKLEKQFLLSGGIVFDPDSIDVSGPKNVIDTLSAIFTRYFEYEKVRDTLVRSVSLLRPQGLNISQKTTSMLIPVEPFTESSMVIPIEVIGLSDSLRGKTFPSEVSLTFRTGLSKFDKISESDFRAIVDASVAFSEDRPARLRVRIDKTPQGIYALNYSPIFVEYLIERKR